MNTTNDTATTYRLMCDADIVGGCDRYTVAHHMRSACHEIDRQALEIDRLKREGSPGVMHSVDQAFCALTVKERNAAYEKVRRLEEELAFCDRSSGVERYLSAECQQNGCLVHKLKAEIGQLTRDLGEARTAARLLYVWFNGDMHDDEDRKFLRQFPWIQESHDGT